MADIVIIIFLYNSIKLIKISKDAKQSKGIQGTTEEDSKFIPLILPKLRGKLSR